MIKSSKYNAINFSKDFNRESKFFDSSLQRVRNIIATTANGSKCFLSFEFIPATMPVSIPASTLTGVFQDGTGFIKATYDRVVELTDRYIYFFEIGIDVPKKGIWYFFTRVTGYTDILYSEECEMILSDDIASENIVEVIASNSDETHGYLTDDYQACGFFRVSELNGKIFGCDKVEYKYSYGRSKILSSENFIKTRFIFVNLSMYQQNLLKWLCNCENLTINGVAYQLVSDFTERNKNEENEICDLQAEFVEVEQSFFEIGSAEMPTDLNIKNLFTI